jgi:hypothetical protein
MVLSVKKQAGRCRLLGTGRELTLRCRDVWNQVPGEIIRVRVRKQWRYAGHPYLSGEIEERRIGIPALGLVPLRLEECGMWDRSVQGRCDPGRTCLRSQRVPRIRDL